MMLSDLLPDTQFNRDVDVTGIADDSRKVTGGELFIAVKGDAVDGHDFIPQVADKAGAVVCETLPDIALDIPIAVVSDLAQRRGMLAAHFYGYPSRDMTVIAVTGTNGKTSCSQFFASAMSMLGQECGVIGTLGAGLQSASQLEDIAMTTPDALTMQRLLKDMKEAGAQAVSLEASSHGLVQGRLNGVDVDLAVFTNITRDHLDYHGDFETYRKAKQLLFQLPGVKHAVINIDDDFGPILAEKIQGRVKTLTYGMNNPKADVYCESVQYTSDGFSAEVVVTGEPLTLQAGLLGEFNVSNVLAVVAGLKALDVSVSEIGSIVSRLQNVPGRMDVVKSSDATVVIDYAHTPDALEKALAGVKLHGAGKIWCVVGCGGNRDTGKRPLMGAIGARLADVLVITDDNSRFEASQAIINDMLAGIEDQENVVVVPDRAEAIRFAMEKAAPEDMVLIAGKGHEPYQDIEGVKQPYSDYEVVARLTAPQNIIVGLGKTGLSCARYLASRGEKFVVMDDNPAPALLPELRAISPDVSFGAIDEVLLARAERIILSPGVPLSSEFLDAAKQNDVKVTGDVALFLQEVVKPVVAITGSNGKSTVTALVGKMLESAGINVGVGGNIGTPCLDLLAEAHDCYVLELSSYQLEILDEVSAEVAIVLNLAPDHLDRYAALEDYYAAKSRVYRGVNTAIISHSLLSRYEGLGERSIVFGGEDSSSGFVLQDGWIQHKGHTIFEVSRLRIRGAHNIENALAACAIVEGLGYLNEQALEGLAEFNGLPHRCEYVGDFNGVEVFNDSKATNPAATLAAVQGLGSDQLVLILGGLAKSADFSVLKEIWHLVKACIVFGQDREKIAGEIGEEIIRLDRLEEVVGALADLCEPGDTVLFAPGCASQDQFLNYEDRGDQFKSLVRESML